MTETKPDSTTSKSSQPLLRAEQMALLERIVASQHFRRATRLREFLLFVGRETIRDPLAALHEQEIGAAVFERPTVYDTGADNIVRVNATELRKRLELYFSAEGAEEPITVEMPRGSYTLLFHARPIPTATPMVEGAPVPPTSIETGRPPQLALRLLWPGLAFVLLSVCILLGWQNLNLRKQVSPWRNGVALHRFWAEFLDMGQQVDIVLADTSFALAEDIEGRSIPLSSYLNYDYKRVDDVAGLSPDRRQDLVSVLDRNNGSAGDYIVAQRILALDHSSSSFRLKFARDYSSEAIKTDSVILIGSRQSNPWVELFADRVNFLMDYDPVHHTSIVHNRHPKTGEDADYVRAGQDRGLSIIAFMPDLSRTGSALIIEGTDSQATRAAGEFVTSDAALGEFLKQIGGTEFPHFELLLENSQLTGTPFHPHILAYRLYPATTGSGGSDNGRAD